jgi:AcrR family transcriptional regulator
LDCPSDDHVGSLLRSVMSPRSFQLGKRQDRVDVLRQRVVDAGRLLLGEARSYSEFTVDSVANRAGLARATVY